MGTKIWGKEIRIKKKWEYIKLQRIVYTPAYSSFLYFKNRIDQVMANVQERTEKLKRESL